MIDDSVKVCHTFFVFWRKVLLFFTGSHSANLDDEEKERFFNITSENSPQLEDDRTAESLPEGREGEHGEFQTESLGGQSSAKKASFPGTKALVQPTGV